MKDFKLSETFIDTYKTKNVDWGPLGEIVYLRTYSRKITESVIDPVTNEEKILERNENWWETVRRVVEGCYSIQKDHCEHYKLPWKNDKAQKSAQIMYDKIFSFKFTPSGRGLWMMGTNFIKDKGAMALLNCAFITTEDINTRGSFPFTWAMDALMLGVGVGFDTLGASKITVKNPKSFSEKDRIRFEAGVVDKDPNTFVIPDSREGWVDALRYVIDGFFLGNQIPDFDYSKIRPYGSPISGFGGLASGPEPLKNMLTGISNLLATRIGEKIRSTDIVDIMNMIGVCVVAGNVRRSAMIALGNWDDKEYTTMKDYNLFPEEVTTHRWASNNSVSATVGKTKYADFVDNIALNGEPGIVWLDNIRTRGRMNDAPDTKDKYVMGLNPCGEIPLESGELCNLVETFPSRHDTFEEFKETLKYAYLYAKTVTLIPTHVPETNAVMMKNRRIGISQSGIIDAFVKHGRRTMMQWNDTGYKYLRELDELYSNWLCIPRSNRITTTKPSGTTALLPGVSAGIHYPHAQYYIRRIRIASNSPLAAPLMEAGYPWEFSAYGMDEEEKKKTLVFSFPIFEKYFEKGKDEVSIWEQVKNAVDYQRWWSDNSVSITVTFKPSEKKDIPLVLEAYEDSLKAVSFLPMEDGGGYAQLPYETITKELYEELAAEIKHKPDFSALTAALEAAGERYCSNEGCAVIG